MSEAVTREFEHVFTREEEQINAATHGLGIVLSLVGLGMLIQQALTSANPIELACYTVFGLSMVAMFTASTLFHLFEDEALKLRFEMFDHMAIYLLIAGTYTPITLLGMGGTTGWVLFVAIWALVGIGLLSELFWKGRPRWVSTAIFLFLGWMFLPGAPLLFDNLSVPGLVWFFGGGAAYSLGTIFYLNRTIPHHHALWHLAVVCGSLAHFVTVWLYLPA